jgi:hypothetical protein
LLNGATLIGINVSQGLSSGFIRIVRLGQHGSAYPIDTLCPTLRIFIIVRGELRLVPRNSSPTLRIFIIISGERRLGLRNSRNGPAIYNEPITLIPLTISFLVTTVQLASGRSSALVFSISDPLCLKLNDSTTISYEHGINSRSNIACLVPNQLGIVCRRVPNK